MTNKAIVGHYEPGELIKEIGPILRILRKARVNVEFSAGYSLGFQPPSGEYRCCYHLGPSSDEPQKDFLFEGGGIWWSSSKLIKYQMGGQIQDEGGKFRIIEVRDPRTLSGNQRYAFVISSTHEHLKEITEQKGISLETISWEDGERAFVEEINRYGIKPNEEIMKRLTDALEK